MTSHELMIKTNHHLIKGGKLTEAQTANIVSRFLAAKSDERTKQSFYNGVKYPNNVDKDGGGHMYPIYFIPPYNDNKKYQTVIPMSPKTHILSANSYELEIIRLLYLFAPNDLEIKDMVVQSLERLKTTCYGYNDCAIGECFHSALIVLRFLATVALDETEWINKLLKFFNKHMNEKLTLRGKGIHGNVLWYYWLCLSELPLTLAESEILRYKDRIIGQLSCSYVMNSENDKINHPVMICILRNCLCRFPEYEYMKNRQPYLKSPENGRLGEKDGRLYFDMQLEG